MVQIKNKWTGEVIKEVDSVNLRSANLSYADLSYADLRSANLSYADLRSANLSYADLSYANLRSANLSYADLSSADLSSANLSSADLSSANLSSAKLEFVQFPSIRLLSSIDLGAISKKLGLELMRRDVQAHPYPEKFDEWAKGGSCPYLGVDRFWLFEPVKELWKPGKPEMTDRDLIMAICIEKKWGIKGFYTPNKEGQDA